MSTPSSAASGDSRSRFCMACGGRLRAAREEGKRRFRCRRCGWTFYGNPIPAAVALVVRGRKILLARRAGAPRVAASDVSELLWFDWKRLPLREIKFPSVRKALRRFGPRSSQRRPSP